MSILIETAHRYDEQGTIVLCKVKREHLLTQQVMTTLGCYSIYGYAPTPNYVIFQVARGNVHDYIWYASKYINDNARLVCYDNEKLAVLETWPDADSNRLTHLEFSLAIDREDVRREAVKTLELALENRRLRKQLGEAGDEE